MLPIIYHLQQLHSVIRTMNNLAIDTPEQLYHIIFTGFVFLAGIFIDE